MARFYAAHGTTALLAATVAAPPAELIAALETIALATTQGAGKRATTRRDCRGSWLAACLG